jgi:ATPase subunit of ABC transporter with duplicated ATPase domains
LAENLAEANKCADTLAQNLEQSEKARKKAEADAKKAKADAAAVEDLRKRLHDAETALSDKVTEQAAREKEILSRLQSQSRRFVSKCSNPCAFLRVTSRFSSVLIDELPFACSQGERIKSMNWNVLKAMS